LSFPLASSFPAKTIDLGAIAVVYTVEIRDTVEVVDYIGVKADFVKALAEVGVPCDYLERTVTFNVNIYDIYEGIDYLERTVTFHIDLAEVGEARDYVYKDILKPLVDVGIPCEWFTKSKGYLRVLRDYAVGEHRTVPAWGAVREFIDTAKTLDYLQKTPLKTLADVGILCDFLQKTLLKALLAVGIPCDFLQKTLLKALIDRVYGEHYPAKDVLKVYADTGKSIDWLVTVQYFVREFMDTAKTLDFLEKTPLKALADAGVVKDIFARSVAWTRTFEYEAVSTGWLTKTVHYYMELMDVFEGLDWRGAFDILRSFKEFVIIRDQVVRALSVILADTLVGEYSVARGIAPAVRDIAKPKDLVTKMAYKIYGHDVRRVYIIREWLLYERRGLIDYIIPEDHNVRIEIAKCLLEAMKRVKEKVEG